MDFPTYQKRAAEWVISRFGPTIFNDKKERALRVLEEALELAQAEGVDEHMILKIVDRVARNESGDPKKEGPQVAVALLSWAESHNISLTYHTGQEITRLETVPIEAARARFQKKIDSGLSHGGAIER